MAFGEDAAHVITAYEPNPDLWDEGFRRGGKSYDKRRGEVSVVQRANEAWSNGLDLSTRPQRGDCGVCPCVDLRELRRGIYQRCNGDGCLQYSRQRDTPRFFPGILHLRRITTKQLKARPPRRPCPARSPGSLAGEVVAFYLFASLGGGCYLCEL